MSWTFNKTESYYTNVTDKGILVLDYERNSILVHFDEFSDIRKTLNYSKKEGILKVDNRYDIRSKRDYLGLQEVIREIKSPELPESPTLKNLADQFNFLMGKYDNTFYIFEDARIRISGADVFSRYLFIGPETSSMRHDKITSTFEEVIGFDDASIPIIKAVGEYRVNSLKNNPRQFDISGKDKRGIDLNMRIVSSSHVTKYADITDLFRFMIGMKLNKEKNTIYSRTTQL